MFGCNNTPSSCINVCVLFPHTQPPTSCMSCLWLTPSSAAGGCPVVKSGQRREGSLVATVRWPSKWHEGKWVVCVFLHKDAVFMSWLKHGLLCGVPLIQKLVVFPVISSHCINWCQNILNTSSSAKKGWCLAREERKEFSPIVTEGLPLESPLL